MMVVACGLWLTLYTIMLIISFALNEALGRTRIAQQGEFTGREVCTRAVVAVFGLLLRITAMPGIVYVSNSHIPS